MLLQAAYHSPHLELSKPIIENSKAPPRMLKEPNVSASCPHLQRNSSSVLLMAKRLALKPAPCSLDPKTAEYP